MMALLLIPAIMGLGYYLYQEEELNLPGKIATVVGSVNDSFDPLFIKYANQNNLDWKFLKRLAWIESRIGLNSRVALGLREPANIEGSKSYDGLSWGLMQTTLSTAGGYLSGVTAMQLNNAEISIMIGAKHVAFLKRNYPQFNERDIAMAYNHGQGNQLNFIKKEKDGTLKASEYLAGRDYYAKYLTAKSLIP